MNHPIQLVRQTAAVLCLLMAHSVLAQPNSEPPPPASNPASVSRVPIPPGGKEIHFRVVDADTGNPIAGVSVRAWVRGNLVTDQTGSCFFPLPASKLADGAGSGDFAYRINFAKEGYVPKFISWSRLQNDRVEDIPAEYTAKLEPAASIGGLVKNRAGEPIAGARVVFSGLNPAAPGQREKTTVAPNYHVERTDENGHWRCNHVPKDFQNMTFRVVHPDYLPTTFTCEGSEAEGAALMAALPDEALLAGTAVMVVGHGIELSGLVVDSQGQPVSGLSITRNHEWRNAAAVFETDADGRFKILNLRPGLMFLTFQAKGLEAQTLMLTNDDPMPELKLVMKPGNILKGKIVDPSGQPVAGARVQMDRLNFQPLEYDFSTQTDADGRFLWDAAPADAHPYFISANGYNSRSEISLVADGQEKIIVLRSAQAGKVFVEGKVVDAETQAPVQKFLLMVREFKRGGRETHSQREVLGKTGEYSATPSLEADAYLIEIRADGYLPRLSERQSPGDGDRRIDLELEKGDALAGTVYLPDGKPAAGAEVAICSEGVRTVLGDRRLIEQFQTNVTVTGPDGSFVFAPPEEARALYAVGEEGFAALDLEQAQPPFHLTLRPWGKIEGTARAGGQALANGSIKLEQPFSYMDLSLSLEDFLAKTDASGHFVFSNVPPIELRVSWVIDKVGHNPSYVVVGPGQTTQLDYGGTGRLISGKLVVPGYHSPINWQAGQEVSLSAQVAPPKTPEFADAAEQSDWMDHFWKSREGKAFVRAQRTFVAKLHSEGGFTIEDVPPGDYQFVAQLNEPREQGGKRIASVKKDIVVSASPGANLQAAVDLGTIEIPATTRLHLGDPAPLFEVKTTDGQPLKLADLRGKYVLVDFWATWCGPCRGETPNLKATYEAYGKDPRFAMVGLSLDALVAAPKEYARQNEIEWIQGFLGPWSQATVPDLYGVEGIPAIFLIDPDGKITARDLRGDAIRQTVGKALGAN